MKRILILTSILFASVSHANLGISGEYTVQSCTTNASSELMRTVYFLNNEDSIQVDPAARIQVTEDNQSITLDSPVNDFRGGRVVLDLKSPKFEVKNQKITYSWTDANNGCAIDAHVAGCYYGSNSYSLEKAPNGDLIYSNKSRLSGLALIVIPFTKSETTTCRLVKN